MTFDAYRPKPDWYSRPPSRLHGPAHAGRVIVLADRVAHAVRSAGYPVDIDIVRWAASLHDVRRHDDGRDPGHGQRAATWLLAERPSTPALFSSARIERLASCCAWHDRSDDADAMTWELACLKDADALDRIRLGEADHELRTPHAAELRDMAATLFGLSEVHRRLGDWQSVREAATRLQLWNATDLTLPAQATLRPGEASNRRCRSSRTRRPS